MRCAICDRVLTEPRYNNDHKSYEPCDTCLTVINDTLSGYTDKPSAAEDELGDDDYDAPFDPSILADTGSVKFPYE